MTIKCTYIFHCKDQPNFAKNLEFWFELNTIWQPWRRQSLCPNCIGAFRWKVRGTDVEKMPFISTEAKLMIFFRTIFWRWKNQISRNFRAREIPRKLIFRGKNGWWIDPEGTLFSLKNCFPFLHVVFTFKSTYATTSIFWQPLNPSRVHQVSIWSQSYDFW
jgi:hypothetical protein